MQIHQYYQDENLLNPWDPIVFSRSFGIQLVYRKLSNYEGRVQLRLKSFQEYRPAVNAKIKQYMSNLFEKTRLLDLVYTYFYKTEIIANVLKSTKRMFDFSTFYYSLLRPSNVLKVRFSWSNFRKERITESVVKIKLYVPLYCFDKRTATWTRFPKSTRLHSYQRPTIVALLCIHSVSAVLLSFDKKSHLSD